MSRFLRIFCAVLVFAWMFGACGGNGEARVAAGGRKDASLVSPPVPEYAEKLKYKAFGEFIQDRFRGYHAGDDIEYEDEKREVPVSAIADGVVVQSGKTAGYGGLIIINHRINKKNLHALYGHLDISSSNLKKGDSVKKGQFLAYLGDNRSKETDGERKHLHFGIYEGGAVRIKGYEPLKENLSSWINPYQFFIDNDVKFKRAARFFEPGRDLGGDVFKIKFLIPEGWEVEYVPLLKALNLFTLGGTGTARERSQIFIRYFDAERFLTLGTVTVHSMQETAVGVGKYTARHYDIEKKKGIPNFPDQPAWRNVRHTVTDFRSGKSGRARYYVVAANPGLDKAVYESVLETMTIR